MISFLRRRLLLGAVTLPLASPAALAQTCGQLTEGQTPGPFFKPDSPLRHALSGKKGLIVMGRVLSPQCRPVAGALLDFWHADEAGDYDNSGFRFRGHQFTDSQGRWRLETVVPGEYPGRARHLHVKVQAPGKRILTTQLYFPVRMGHHDDGLYQGELEMKMPKDREGAFDFVIEA